MGCNNWISHKNYSKAVQLVATLNTVLSNAGHEIEAKASESTKHPLPLQQIFNFQNKSVFNSQINK